MGMAFTDMDASQDHHLRQLIDLLIGGTFVPKRKLVLEPGIDQTTDPIDALAFFEEMMEYFRKRQLLSREEFQRIAKRVRRP